MQNDIRCQLYVTPIVIYIYIEKKDRFLIEAFHCISMNPKRSVNQELAVNAAVLLWVLAF